MSRHELGLRERLGALREAVEVADGRLEVPELPAARRVLAKAGAREALGTATVVALAGATGSGKSTLFNALSGSQVSTPGVRRPTTGVAHATSWGGEPAETDRLLDWLEVPRRHRHPAEPELDGLVLLDLPDHDSTRVEHRLEVDRLVELVDVLVWVLDPQKYADAAVHDRYLAPYASHAGTLVVVLNQVDRLTDEAAAVCVRDLRGLLDGEGLERTPLLTASARTGEGVPALKDHLAARVASRRAADDRLAADVRSSASALSRHCAGAPDAALDGADRRQLTSALANAAGVPTVVRAVTTAAVRDGTARTGWPLVRWSRNLRPDPLRRLHLSKGPEGPVARTSLPPASASQRAAVSTALRRARDDAGQSLPQAWRDDLQRTAVVTGDELPDRLDSAVAGADLGPRRTPLWQRAVALLQWLLLAAAVVGLLWLLTRVGLGFLQLDAFLPRPTVEGLPVPTLLLVGGLVAGLLVALLCRPLVRAGARRRGRLAERRLLTAVDGVAGDAVVAPLEATLADARRCCDALARAST